MTDHDPARQGPQNPPAPQYPQYPQGSQSAQGQPGGQPQQPAGLERLDPPEVKRVAGGEDLRVAPATAQPDAAEQLVDQPTQLPQRVGRVPPGASADPADRCERLGRRAGTGALYP